MDRAKYPQYATLEGDFGAAIVVKVVRWTGWEFAPRVNDPGASAGS